MKLITSITIGVATATALMLSACGASENAKPAEVKKEVVKPTIDASQLSYRNNDLSENAVTPQVKYSEAAPGTSKRFKRAFQDAPPMIPHSVEGLLPITKESNQCLGCHMPDVAKSMGATPIPVSHFTNFRPSSSYALKGENTSDGTLKHVSIKKQKELYQGRYNCSQCHAPQANVAPLVGNNFQPVYSKPDGEFKSSWNDNEFMKDIDTTK
jgi:cytochrome c-type protein NapB